MSSPKVYKGGECSQWNPLHFMEFSDDGGGGGTVPCLQEAFQEAPLPQGSESSAAAPPCVPVDIEQQLQEAYSRGRQEGIEAMEAQLGEALRAFSQAMEEISRLRETILKNSTDDMMRIVRAIAERVIHCEVASNPEVILGALQKALSVAVRSDAYHVKVSPDDFALVTEKKPLFLAGINGLQNITIEPDPAITRGGCLVESEYGAVDATLESQLEEIEQKFLWAAAG